MPTVYMVRHGRAAASFANHRDPGLDDVGRRQAEATAAALDAELAAPIPIRTSPLARAQETAAALTARWGSEATIEPRIAEIPAPIEDLRERTVWLRKVMAGPWTALSKDLLRWRQEMIDCVLGLETDTVAFCHFVAINVIVGAATGDDRLIAFRPDNGSVTRFSTDGGELTLLELGSEGSTRVN